ncbi:isomerase [Kaistia algarum]|uniref:sugar phosphate isomerase/epimerase family protein n=1 Tax=Kaistia algarum TaxID=2083279 RepID=UPI000CE81D27|nr:sugar phosphate isomerase/epimerase [Kaistia algarum]MCX5513168.1 sugar phosphate isomerase/epimerase [Kaistia algarum]PPE81366.1 isomerase [Kaistia algarum]
MKFGFNLLLWTSHVREEHWPILDKLKAAGYDGVEVPMFEGEPSHYARLGNRLRDAGLGATGIGVMPGGGRSAVSADPAERAGALGHIKWLVDCTAALGGDLAAGPFHQPLGEFTGAGPTADEKARCAEVHKPAAHYAATAGIALSVEPLNRFECYFLNTALAAKALVDAVGEPNYGFLYDTFHFNIEEKNQARAIHATAGAFNHFHISENDRGVPGTGPIDFASVFKALKATGYDGWMTVESFGSALPDLAAATRVWRPLFDKPEDVYLGAIKLMKEGWAAA